MVKVFCMTCFYELIQTFQERRHYNVSLIDQYRPLCYFPYEINMMTYKYNRSIKSLIDVLKGICHVS